MFTFKSDSDAYLASMALRIAAEQFERDAVANAEHERVVRQFKDQANRARSLADKIEQAQ